MPESPPTTHPSIGDVQYNNREEHHPSLPVHVVGGGSGGKGGGTR